MPSIFSLRATGTQADLDLNEVRRGLLVLVDPKHGCELRGLPSGRSYVCAGSDIEGMVRAAKALADDNGIYYALNPIPADLGHATRVGDVLARRWLLIDCDAGQPSDKNATQPEKDNAQALAMAVKEDLDARDWPAPVVIDSGNGMHLLYRIDQPNTPEIQVALRGLLTTLSERFARFAPAHVDKSVHNASRIAKLPGTWARKGPHSPERPHRMAWITFCPEHPQIVSLEQIIAASAATVSAKDTGPSAFVMLARNGDGDRGRAYAKRALELECANVAIASVGQRNNTLNIAAFKLGTLVGAGLILEQEVQESLIYAAIKIGLSDREARATVRSGIEAGKEKPRELLPPKTENASGASAPDPQQPHEGEVWTVTFDGELAVEAPASEFPGLFARQAKDRIRHFGVLSLRRLMASEFPDPQWAVAGLLAEGLNLLAGSPKSGKSMMALNLALTVAGGGLALGNIRTVPGGVLYLSLEDLERRVQYRARKMAELIGRGTPERLSVATKWPRMDQGGLGLLAEWVKRTDQPRLVIVDVLQKFRPQLRDRGNAYEQDSQHMYAIKEFADENHLTVLVLHHTRKAIGKDNKDKDQFEDVSGTQGLAGGCDGVMVLKRQRNSNEAVVSITGRDAAEVQLALQFDPETLTWTSLGSADEHLRGAFQVKVLDYMKARTGMPVWPTELCDSLNAGGQSVRKTLQRLYEKGLIARKGQAWTFPAAPASGDDELF